MLHRTRRFLRALLNYAGATRRKTAPLPLEAQTGADRAFQDQSDVHLAAMLAMIINEQKRMGTVLDEIAATLSAAHSPLGLTPEARRDVP